MNDDIVLAILLAAIIFTIGAFVGNITATPKIHKPETGPRWIEIDNRVYDLIERKP